MPRSGSDAGTAEPSANAGKRPHVVFVIGEDAHKSEETLPAFARALEERYALRCTVLLAKPNPANRSDLPGLEALAEADVAVFALRDRQLPDGQMKWIKDYVNAGKPLVAIRTSTHAFSNWPEFGPQVLGTGWKKHFGLESNTDVRFAPDAVKHRILAGLAESFPSHSCLYEVAPLPAFAKPLLLGTSVGPGDGREEDRTVQPVAWTIERQGRRAFCTTLGVPEDYRRSPFRQLLTNAIFWTMDRPVTTTAKPFFTLPSLGSAKITLRLHAIRVADDNGDRLTPISPVQVQAWVDYANEIYAPAGIGFSFDSRADGPDWSVLRHPAINSMMGGSDLGWKQTQAAANAEAAKRPGKLVLFFRHGPGGSTTGNGFSSVHDHFVTMPGFWRTWVPSGQNINVLAHETGHFLGLDHPFGPEFKTVKEAEESFLKHNRNPKVFDGDGLADTPPDPWIIEIQREFPAKGLYLAGIRLDPDRTNIMSYWDYETKKLSREQIQRVLATLQTHPHRRTLLDPQLVKKIPDKPQRLTWIHSKGQFRSVRGVNWVEEVGKNRHEFAQTGRNDDYVELKNVRAEVWVRLYRDRCELKGGPQEEFKPFYFGVWER